MTVSMCNVCAVCLCVWALSSVCAECVCLSASVCAPCVSVCVQCVCLSAFVCAPCVSCLCVVHVSVAVWVHTCVAVSLSLCLCMCLALCLCVWLCVSVSVCDCPHGSPGYLQSSPPVLTTNLSSCEKRMLVTCAECPKYRLCLACGTGKQFRVAPSKALCPQPS